MRYLVDADVLSEPTKPRPQPGVLDWLLRHDSDLLLSSITLGEIKHGILLLPSGRRRNNLQVWFESGVERFPVVDFDSAAALAWAKLLAKLKRAGRAMPVKDSLIAATAKRHEVTVATRNTADFKHAGVKLVNPFDA